MNRGGPGRIKLAAGETGQTKEPAGWDTNAAPDSRFSGWPEGRRQRLMDLLRELRRPVTGSELAERLGVSRQVVVQDCALLRVGGADIVATPRGYMLPGDAAAARAVIACRHDREHTAEELTLMVDHGLKVLDVTVEHPVYGELRGPLQLMSREDVGEFEQRVIRGEVSLLSELSGGVHLHAVEAASVERIDKARQALREHGFLVE